MALSKKCPECEKTGHDSKGDHLYLMKDGKRWACNRSQHHENGKPYYQDLKGNPICEGTKNEGDDENDAPVTGGNLFSLLSNITAPSVLASTEPVLPSSVGSTSGTLEEVRSTFRGIEPKTFKKFKTRGKYDSSGKLIALEHDILEAVTNKVLTKKGRDTIKKNFYMVCPRGTLKGKAIQFFGQDVFPRAKRLLIVEGELDAMAAYQMLEKWKVAVWSLPFGANIKVFVDNMKALKGFKEIYICVDQDTDGTRVSRDIVNLLPHAKVMEISEKDANDMWTKGKQAEFVSAFWDAQIFKPSTIIRVSDVIDKVMQKPVMGVPWPWPTLTAKTYGRNPGQGMYVGAGVKIGKSEFINEVIKFDVMNKRKIAVLKYEEPPDMTVKRVAGKIDGIFYHRPGVAYSDAVLKATSLSMDEYLLMYPAFGPATWDSTREFITYAALSGYKTIIIDPVTKLTNSLTSSDTETELRKLSDDIACMAQDMGFFYIITCHLKAPTSGPPHERGGRVDSNQFRGSRAMMENTFYMLGIERNKDPLLTPLEQNTSTFVLLEDRNFGETASFPVVYDKIDQSYLEPPPGLIVTKGGF